MNQYSRRRGWSRRRRGRTRNNLPLILSGAVLALILLAGGIFFFKNNGGLPTLLPASPSNAPGGQASETPEETEPLTEEQELQNLLDEAKRLAAGYDYDGAIVLLTGNEKFKDTKEAAAAAAEYEEIKSTLVRVDPSKVTHVFFHSLIMDTSKAFDGDRKQNGYNQMMTTKDEFEKILQSMYDRGFVLVRLHDIAYETTDENGNPVFKAGDIMLPPGKQAFVMSQDDVCYYEYMDGDGFASRIVVGEDGKPVCEMKMDDGSISVGAYDLVPLLDEFIEEHPDFSYRGAKAVLAFTGYNGILGYRTAASYGTAEYQAEHPDFNYEEEKAQAAKVAQALKDDGYELASHSWGHRDMGAISMEDFVTDTNKWDTEVAPLIGGTDIILFPFGSDISDWRPYKDDNERFQYLKSKGFRYFCNVDSSQYYVQIGTDHMRQGRRNLDGYRMYYDLPESNPTKTHLDDLFNVEEVFDRSRPTPVPPMG